MTIIEDREVPFSPVRFPEAGDRVTVTEAYSTRWVGEETGYDVPAGATGVVEGHVREWFDVHVKLDADGAEVWVAPDALTVLDGPGAAVCAACAEAPADAGHDRCRDCRTWRDADWCAANDHPHGVAMSVVEMRRALCEHAHQVLIREGWMECQDCRETLPDDEEEEGTRESATTTGVDLPVNYVELREEVTACDHTADVTANDVNGLVEVWIDPPTGESALELVAAVANVRLTPEQARRIAAALVEAADALAEWTEED